MSLTSEQYIEQLSGELKKLAGKLPLGFEYLRLTGQSPHPGGVDYMGQTATRAMYSDLWVWLNENKPDAIVSEEEWQSLYISQNGNVAKYSTGDGFTTFRFPRVVGYFKGSDAVSEVGKYMKEGLPNITGVITTLRGANVTTSGALSTSQINTTKYIGTAPGGEQQITLDASLSNSIYGNSNHVTPETVTVVMGVIAFGVAGSIGESTEEGIVAELGEHGAKLGELERGVGRAGAYIVETWRDGAQWYNVYSNGFIEQGGIATGSKAAAGATISLPKEFKTTDYTLKAHVISTFPLENADVSTWVKTGEKTSTSFKATTGYTWTSSSGLSAYSFSWIAKGY